MNRERIKEESLYVVNFFVPPVENFLMKPTCSLHCTQRHGIVYFWIVLLNRDNLQSKDERLHICCMQYCAR